MAKIWLFETWESVKILIVFMFMYWFPSFLILMALVIGLFGEWCWEPGWGFGLSLALVSGGVAPSITVSRSFKSMDPFLLFSSLQYFHSLCYLVRFYCWVFSIIWLNASRPPDTSYLNILVYKFFDIIAFTNLLMLVYFIFLGKSNLNNS